MKAFALTMLLLTGCAQTVTLSSLQQGEVVPRASFIAHVFTGGQNDRFRVILLMLPGAKVDVVDASSDIYVSPMSFDEASAFILRGDHPQSLSTETVRYRGDVVGYLLTYTPRNPFRQLDEWLEVRIYEFDGKIHFAAERMFGADG